MTYGKFLAAAAAGAVIACAGLTRADSPISLKHPAPVQRISPGLTGERTALMDALHNFGMVEDLESRDMTLTGYLSAGYSYNFDNPLQNANIGHLFDTREDDPTFHQLGLVLERAIERQGDRFDIGGKLDVLWGGDGRFIHANGANFYGSSNPQLDPDEQVDVVQAFLTFNIPWGDGLTITAGKFVTPLGIETINATTNTLYSRSFLFAFATPFTQTGVLGTYTLSDEWTATAGLTLGWDQALEDNNDGYPDFLGTLNWQPNEETAVQFGLSTGPQRSDDDSDWRTLFDVIASYRASEELTLAVNATYAFEPGAASDTGDADWYGIAGYVSYKIDDYLVAQGRGEWFNDEDGARGLGTTVYELTAGVNIIPFPHEKFADGLILRPEIRYDYSDEDIFDGGSKNSQLTIGADIMYKF